MCLCFKACIGSWKGHRYGEQISFVAQKLISLNDSSGSGVEEGQLARIKMQE